jgi:prolyl 4-hydroxylase
MEKALRPAPSKAEIIHYLAVKAAEGVDGSQDWAKALHLLHRAAELGLRLAQAELAGLSGQWALAHDILAGEAVPESRWSGRRNSIDLAKWLEPPLRPVFSEGPRIAVAEDIAAPEMCDWLIARARTRLKPAKIRDRGTGDASISTARTNSACLFRRPDSDLVVEILRAKIAAITEMRVDAMEVPTVLHYSEGQEFLPHFDITLNPDSPDYEERLAKGDRQRVITFLLYLNDDYEGGATEFPVIDLSWKGRKGAGLFFWNVQPCGALDERTLHAGAPVSRGEKWVLSQWIEGRPE